MTQTNTPLAVLTIAGSDSSGGAGLQADLKTWAALGLYGCCAVTCVTAQATTGVTGAAYLDPALVREQILAVAGDMPLAAVKIGMLGRADIIKAVDEALASIDVGPIVLDPVMTSKAGSSLLEADAVEALTVLMSRASIVTPNRLEAAKLTHKPCETLNGGMVAARELQARFGCEAVLVKGFIQGEEIVDVFFDGMRMMELRGPLARRGADHGSGCTLSAAIAGYLALGLTPIASVEKAKAFTSAAIHQAHRLGKGIHPVNQFADLQVGLAAVHTRMESTADADFSE